MVKVIMGLKGNGKTKQMIDLCNAAAADSKGAVICMERGQKLRHEIKRKARLIDTIPYDIRSYQVLRGFITGLHAGNYDIRDIFIDSLFKVSGDNDMLECAKFLSWCDAFGEKNEISFTISISADTAGAAEDMRKYIL